jgi:multiple sugar transport system permease protein
LKDHRLAFGLLAPAMLVVAATTVYPLVFSFITSFRDWRLTTSLRPGPFVGLENYQLAFADDPEFWHVIGVTAKFVVLDVAATILIALGLAILLLRAGFAKSVLRTLIILPFAMSPALIGISWRFMFNPEFGAFQRTIGFVLPFMRDVDWFSSPGLAMAALISSDVWHWAPYFTFMLMGGLASIPPETQEAARIDGASDWRVFVDVTLPQLAPVLVVAVILKTVFALKVFDAIVTMTGGGPGIETTTLAYFAYNIGFRAYDMGYAAAVSYVLTAILFLLSLSYMRFMFRR